MVHYLKLQPKVNPTPDNTVYLQVYGGVGALTLALKDSQKDYDLIKTLSCNVAQWKREAKQAESNLIARLAINPEKAKAAFARK